MISSGELKWKSSSGLVLMLPHGYEGQGPEHSSARIERFLQLVDDDPDEAPGFTLETEYNLRTAFYSCATRSDGYGTISRNQMHDLLSQVNEIVKNTSNNGGVIHGGASSSIPDKRGQTLLLKEILSSSKSKKVFNEDDFLKYSTTWIRRNYESNYNMSVVNVTSPAQHFHVLRRQIHRPFVKPLILLTSKWLHYHSFCKSNLNDIGPGTWFHRIITEKSLANNLATQKKRGIKFPLVDDANVKKVVFCSGKIYYELYHARNRKLKSNDSNERKEAKEVSLVRLEQLAPFPMDLVASAVNDFPNAEIAWVQEEPKNQGAWTYVQPRFHTALRYFYRGSRRTFPKLEYFGRPVSATTAGGSFREHIDEQRDIIERALNV